MIENKLCPYCGNPMLATYLTTSDKYWFCSNCKIKENM